MSKIGFSIITVCLNAGKVIEETIRSVLEQGFRDYEYILIDGSSTDETPEIIRRYAQTDRRIRFISEKDQGLYDAMNKGIGLAEGEYIHFLNAGDRYADPEVLEKTDRFIHSSEGDRADLFFGNIIYRYPDGSEKLRRYPSSCGKSIYYVTGDCINHQALFAKRGCFENALFDTGYRYCADREWMMRMHKAGKKYRAMDILICRYSLDPESVSIKHEKEAWEEAEKCMKRHYPVLFPVYRLVDRIRHGRLSAKVLHRIYKVLYIK